MAVNIAVLTNQDLTELFAIKVWKIGTISFHRPKETHHLVTGISAARVNQFKIKHKINYCVYQEWNNWFNMIGVIDRRCIVEKAAAVDLPKTKCGLNCLPNAECRRCNEDWILRLCDSIIEWGEKDVCHLLPQWICTVAWPILETTLSEETKRWWWLDNWSGLLGNICGKVSNQLTRIKYQLKNN